MKKTIALLISVIMIFMLSLSVFAVDGIKHVSYGDVNGIDGITAEDARLALRMAVGASSYKTIINTYPKSAVDPEAAADVDGDGKVTPNDARLILRFAIGQDKEFFPAVAGKDTSSLSPKSDGRDINFWNLWDQWRGVFDADAFRAFFNN